MKPKPVSQLLEGVATMPPRRHWPDQWQDFDIQASEVTNWLQQQPDVMQWLFDTLRGRGLIVFDAQSGTWRGRNWRGGQ